MSERQSDQQTLPSEWQSSALRLTAFPGAPIEIPRNGLWVDLVGEAPEVQTFKKSIELQEIGLLESRRLILTATPVGIDWRLMPSDTEVSSESLPSIGSFSQGLEVFLPLMYRWLDEHCPNLQRLAFGAELLLSVEDCSLGYRRLSSYLPFEIDPERTSDFLYQINRPRESRLNISTLRVNRLSKWSMVRFNVGIQYGDQSFDLPGIEQFACRLEIDINTALDFQGILSRDKLRMVFEELVDLGKEIAEKGDIP